MAILTMIYFSPIISSYYKKLITTLYLILSFSILGVQNAGARTNSFPFKIPWDDQLPAEIDMGQRILDPPAGKHGRLIAKGDHLVFADGVIPRFWGVGLTFSSGRKTKFPPDKEVAQKIVNKLAQYGFNHVRFVGLDGSAPEIIDTWLQTGTVESPTLDKLDYFVHLLRKKGIYYSFSINNHANRLLDNETGIPTNNLGRKLKRYKHVRLLQDAAIDSQVRWFQAFYSHVNKYSGLSYAEDPANLYVAAVNEDSVSLAYYNYYDKLGKDTNHILNESYKDFLASYSAKRNRTEKTDYPESLPPPYRLRDATNSTKRLVAEFLYYADRIFATKVKAGLRATGFQGLFTFNNNWAGYSALYTNHIVGDYIEMHSYFDHPRRSGGTDRVTRRSLISDLYPPDLTVSKMSKDYANPFNLLFLNLLADRPLIVSEWNHNAWSDRPYEGPLLMTVYAAFQGIQFLDSHTFFVHPNPDPKNEVPSEVFAIGPNPLWMALYPSLSLAFINGYLTEGVDDCHWSEAVTEDVFFEDAASIGMRPTHMNRRIPLNTGYWYKLRKTLIGTKPAKPCDFPKHRNLVAKTESGKILWSKEPDGQANLRVVTDKFVAVAGDAAPAYFDFGSVRIKLNDHGIVTVITLDDLPLSESRKILVTSVSGFENTGWDRHKISTGYEVSQSGHAPVYLTTPRGEVALTLDSTRDIKVYAVTFAGLRKLEYGAGITRGKQGVSTIYIGEQPTPWYLVTY